MSTAESQPEPVTHQKPHPLEFYALGKVSNPPQMTTTFKPSMAFRGQSNDLLQLIITILMMLNFTISTMSE